MFGILYYLYFIILGNLYSKYLFNKDKYFNFWLGSIIGNLILMVGIIIPSFIFNFTILSHIILLFISTIPLFFIIKKTKIKSHHQEIFLDNKTFIFLIIPLTLLIAILLTNHILVPTKTGGYASGQSTYGDLQMHLGFITNIAESKKFPPDYVFLSGHKLNYPFFVDMLSSSLYLLGTSLRLSILIPSYLLSMLLVMGFYFLAYKISNKKWTSILATIFFFLGGGLGFVYFFEGSKANPELFTRIFTDFYHTPTNFNEHNIRWANPICDMIIPQRTTMAGWCIILPCLWLLIDGCKSNKRKTFIVLGLFASCLPMIHTHSFLALGIISAGMFFNYFSKTRDKKAFFINFLIYGIIVFIFAFPQLFYWTFTQTNNNSSFLNISFNWVNKTDPYLWFYLKNWGLTFIFLIPAFIYAKKDNKYLFISSLLLVLISEFIIFQPNEYDNNKLFFISYMIFIILVSDYLIYLYQKLYKVKGRMYLSIIVIILGALSGILTIGREYYSGSKYETFSKDMIDISNYIKENTPKEAIFLTSTTHINPVASLSGRNIYLGSSLYVYFHGFTDEYNKRNIEITEVYQGTYDEILSFCKQHHIDYLYLGISEKNSLNPNYDEINKFEKIATYGTEELYKVNQKEIK